MPVRPCILVVDPETGGGISSRKLVLESARFNVIATFSCVEALATLERFPRVHAVLLNAVLHEQDCGEFMAEVKERFPEPVRMIVGKLDNSMLSDVDVFVDSYSPRVLLEHLHRAFPKHAANFPVPAPAD